MEELIIFPAGEEHLDTVYDMICKLEETCLSYPGFSHAYRTNLGDKRIRYFLAARGEEILGFASLHIEELLHHASPVGELQELIVREEARGAGAGAALVAAVETAAQAAGCTQLEVCANVRRKATHRFYENRGFVNDHFNFCKPLDRQRDDPLV